MDFAEVRERFYTPRKNAGGVPSSSPARRLRDALEPLAMVDVWSDAAAAEGEARGLNFFPSYVGGRGSLLGDPNGAVVAATFGVFEPGFVAGTWDEARATCSPAEFLDMHVRSATTALRTALDGVGGVAVDEVVDPLRDAIEGADAAGRPLFAGLRAQGWPDDAHGRLWRAASALREYRGDAHLAACTAAGLGGLEMNVVTELWVGFDLLEYTSTRGWPQEAMDAAIGRLEAGGLLAGGALTDAGRQLRDSVEEATDRAEQHLIDALGSRLDTIVRKTAEWSDAVIVRGWFPPDPYKRAAG